ncbi:MAG: EamA family transporter [Micrococcales bacterium]|nr:EamA family transporter [Micrococcales bacterium]
MTTSARAVPAPLLVLVAVVSVQFGGALAATLVPQIGAAGSVTLRLGIAAAVLLVIARPRLRGYSRRAWATVVAYGLAMGLMNLSFYASLGHLPIGVAVTVEFIGPLLLATALSRRPKDFLAVAAAAVGVVLISEALSVPLESLEWTGLGLAALAGAFWAAYILTSSAAGREFPALDGVALAMVVGLVIAAPFGLGTLPEWDGSVVARGIGIALLSSVLPYSLELVALRRLSPAVFGILLSLEPAVAALSGFLVLGQRLHGLQLLGMVLVVLASALVMGGRPRGPEADTDLEEGGARSGA